MKTLFWTVLCSFILSFGVLSCTTDDDDSNIDTETSPPWYTIDELERTVETSLFSYKYDTGGHPHGSGVKQWVDKRVDEGISFPSGDKYVIDGCGTGYHENINDVPHIQSVNPHDDYVELEITIGSRDVRHRIFRDLAILEIEYIENPCGWVAEEWRVTSDLLWVMHGMPEEDYSKSEIEWLRAQSEANCGDKVRSDCMVEAAGAEWEDVQYKGYIIAGALTETGHGIGMVSKVDDSHAVEGGHWRFPKWRIGKAEWFHLQDGTIRWVYFVTDGREELLSLGKAIVDEGGALPLVGIW